MIKEAKYFRKQAIKAESLARSHTDVEVVRDLSALASAYRAQAAALKVKSRKKFEKLEKSNKKRA